MKKRVLLIMMTIVFLLLTACSSNTILIEDAVVTNKEKEKNKSTSTNYVTVQKNESKYTFVVNGTDYTLAELGSLVDVKKINDGWHNYAELYPSERKKENGFK